MPSSQCTSCRKHALILTALVLVIFICGLWATAAQHHRQVLDSAQSGYQADIRMLAQLGQETLIQENYALAAWFIESWGREHADIVSLTLTRDDNQRISDFIRPHFEGELIRLEYQTDTLFNHPITLHLAFSTALIDRRIDQLYQNIALTLAVIILTLSLGMRWIWNKAIPACI